MTLEEIKKRIEELESDIFLLNMKDFWQQKDYDLNRKWRDELLELEKLEKEYNERTK